MKWIFLFFVGIGLLTGVLDEIATFVLFIVLMWIAVIINKRGYIK